MEGRSMLYGNALYGRVSHCGAVEGYGMHHELYPEEVFKAFDPADRREVGSSRSEGLSHDRNRGHR